MQNITRYKSYHNHSLYSDGTTSIEEIICKAIELNLCEIGISDHFVKLNDGGELYWAMSEESTLAKYFNEIDRLKEKHSDKISIKKGLEIDYAPNTITYVSKLVKILPLDYTIGSIHMIDKFPVDECAGNWENISQNERNIIIVEYWKQIKQLAQTRIFTIVGHIDLYKKFAYLPTIDVSEYVNAALDAIADADMMIELNTSGLHKPIKEQYPSEYIIRLANERNIPIIVNADAHCPEHIIRDFNKAYMLLRNIGYKNIVK